MLKIGWSKRDVSTTEPVNIPGQFFPRISKGIMDPITLNCLVVDDGNDIVFFLSGDFVSGCSVIDDIRDKIREKRVDISAEKIIFNVTHTHCGADLRKDNSFLNEVLDGENMSPSSKYRDFMSDMAVEAICEAYDTRCDGYIGYGYGYAVVSHSRRSMYSDDVSLRDNKVKNALEGNGHVKAYGITNDDKFIGYEGGADHFANFMYTFDKNKNLTGAIINIPCPSQNSEMEYMLTADYWHNVREILYSKYGDIGIVSQCAAAGDLSPRTLHYYAAEERRYKLKYGAERKDREMSNRKDIAERICNSFDEVLSWAKNDLIDDAAVRHVVKTIKLKKLLVTDEQYKLAKYEIEIRKSQELVLTGDKVKDMKKRGVQQKQVEIYQSIIDRYEDQQLNSYSDMELHVVRIGDIAFTTNAYELFVDYQLQIQARSPYTQTFIIQLTDQPEGNYHGYLATNRGMENLGYSANIHTNWISPDGGHTLVEETLSELKKISD